MKTKTTEKTNRRNHHQAATKQERLTEIHAHLEGKREFDIDALAKRHNACRKTVLADIRIWKRERGLYVTYSVTPREERYARLRTLKTYDLEALCEEFNIALKTLRDDIAKVRDEGNTRKVGKELPLHQMKSPFKQVSKRPVEDRFLYNAF